MNVVQLTNVTKSFQEGQQKRKVLDRINLTIQSGEFIVLKGEMGAGKTTLINLILGLQRADSGTVEVFGYLPEQPESKLKLGLMLQKTKAPEDLKVEELINLIRSFYSDPYSTQELLIRSNLEPKRSSWASSEKLSGGEERSLFFALAIAGNPELLILDEPTTGLDPQARKRVLQQVRDFAEQGKTILLVSHIESDADAISNLATRTLTLSNGKIQEVRTERFKQLQPAKSQNFQTQLKLDNLTLKSRNLLSMLLGQTKVELLKLSRQPLFLMSMLFFYGLWAFFPSNMPNAIYLLIGLAAFNLFLFFINSFSTQIATERKQGWTKLLRVTPLPAAIYLLSKIIVILLASNLGIILMFSLGADRFNIDLPVLDWIAIFSTLNLGMIPFAIFGFAIGCWIDASSISVITIITVGLATLSSGLISLSKMPEWLQNLIPFSPFYHYAQLVLRAAHIHNDGYLWLHWQWLTWIACVMLLLAVWAYRRDRAIS